MLLQNINDNPENTTPCDFKLQAAWTLRLLIKAIPVVHFMPRIHDVYLGNEASYKQSLISWISSEHPILTLILLGPDFSQRYL